MERVSEIKEINVKDSWVVCKILIDKYLYHSRQPFEPLRQTHSITLTYTLPDITPRKKTFCRQTDTKLKTKNEPQNESSRNKIKQGKRGREREREGGSLDSVSSGVVS